MRIKLLVIVLLCASLPFPARAFAAAPTPAPQKAEIVPGELVVILKAGKSMGALAMPGQARAQAQKRPGLEKLNASIVNVPPGEESAYIAKLQQLDEVLVAEPNYVVKAILYPDDPAYPADQYGPALIQAEPAWDTTTGSNSVIIAIIDSGLDASHPEFAGRIVAGYDFVQNDSNPQDEMGHGTHVAGIAAAAGNNTQGMAGLAWGARIMPLRVLDGFGGGNSANVAAAIMQAADNGANIINLSLGMASSSVALENAVYYAYSHGVAIFAAAGNSGTSPTLHPVFYPAAYPQVMAVGSVNNAMTRAASSNYGAALDLMAPGVGIYSTLPMTGGFFYNALGYSTEYDVLSGTSMASPHAAGAAALLASLPCFDTPDKIYQALTDTARDLGAGGWDEYYGHGLIQIADAMALCPLTPPGTPFAVEYDLVTSQNCNPLVQYNWRDASTGTQQPAVGDSGSALISLPFPFEFGGQPYNDIRAHANGFISLGNNNADPTDGNFRSNFLLPTAAKPNNFIAPFWDDLTDNSGAGRIYTTTLGTTPNRQFVIEYWNFKRPSASGSLSFETILFEDSNNIKMQYSTLVGPGSNGSSATVGLEYGNIYNGFAGYEYSYNRPGALESGLALLFIPYTGGSPTLPSDTVCPQMRAVTLEAGSGTACSTLPATFDVEIAVGELPYRSALKIQQLGASPVMPAAFLDLQHYADINLAYSPPAPSLSPMPDVYVCYEYTLQDVLAAGGHAENLFITAHNIATNQWQRLPTTVDASNSHLMALAPHFSYYGVATLNPSANASGGSIRTADGLGLPVTGGAFSGGLSLTLSIAAVLLLGGVWIARKRKREDL